MTSMTNTTLQTIQQTRQALSEGLEELKLSKATLLAAKCTIEQHQEVFDRIKALKESYQQQLNDFLVSLPDGRLLLRPQYEALEKFTFNNDKPARDPFRWGWASVSGIKPIVVIKGNVIVECDFADYGLRTLEGLEAIWSIRKLDLSENPSLTSLKGIPTKEIEEISAHECGLSGDLSEIAGASKLRKLRVSSNRELTSLKGVSTQELVRIYASKCGLTGDLSDIAGATKLKTLDVSGNKSLTSLNGIPTQAIEEIMAWSCGLTGDLSGLARASKLKKLDAGYNEALNSLYGIPTQKIEVISVLGCSLSGDHTFLSQAAKLRAFHLDPPLRPLILDESQFKPGVVRS
jgi:hypothetical protein